MASVTLTLTDDQMAGLSYATEQSNAARLAADPKAETEIPEQYAQRVFSAVCDDYVRQAAATAQAAFADKVREEAAPVFDAVIKGYISQSDADKRAAFAADVAKSAEANLGVTVSKG